MFFYQVPYVPELLFESNDLAILKQIFYTKPMGMTNKDKMTADDLEVFKYTFSQKGINIFIPSYLSTIFLIF